MEENSVSFVTAWGSTLPLILVLMGLTAMALLYVARTPAHELILSVGRTLQAWLVLLARFLMRGAASLSQRNREALLAWAEDEQERALERELSRMHDLLQSDLSEYPALHRALGEQVARLDADYRETADPPPQPPAWLEAVAAVAAVDAKGDPAVAKILEDMHGTLQHACHNALLQYRASSQRRHVSLKRMRPYWRRLNKTMSRIDSTLERLELRARRIDRHMERYEALRSGEHLVERSVVRSTWVRVIASGLTLALGAAAILFNIGLLSQPLTPLMAGNSAWNNPTYAATFLVLWHVGLGLALAETNRISHLSNIGQSISERVRRTVTTGGLLLLGGFAVFEAYLAYAGTAAATGATDMWQASIAMMLLAGLLPFATALAALPLESFLHSARYAAASLLALALQAAAVLLRLAGQLVRRAAGILVRAYDVLICLPLWVEKRLQRQPAALRARSAAGS